MLGRSCHDGDICKAYLVGCCPYTLFQNTRSSIGNHPMRETQVVGGGGRPEQTPQQVQGLPGGWVHDQRCKTEWEGLSDRERRNAGYEQAVMRQLAPLIRQCDNRISHHQDNVSQRYHVSDADLRKILDCQRRIGSLLNRVQRLAEGTGSSAVPANDDDETDNNDNDNHSNAGQELQNQRNQGSRSPDVDGALLLMRQVQPIRRAQEQLERGSAQETQITVCPVSGNFLSARDTDERMMSHFGGKTYQGWKVVRARYKELQKKYEHDDARVIYGEGFHEHERERERRLGDDRGRDRGRDRDWGRERPRDWREDDRWHRDHGGRGREMRFVPASRGRPRSYSRSRSRDRDVDRHRRADRYDDRGRYEDDRKRGWDRDAPDHGRRVPSRSGSRAGRSPRRSRSRSTGRFHGRSVSSSASSSSSSTSSSSGSSSSSSASSSSAASSHTDLRAKTKSHRHKERRARKKDKKKSKKKRKQKTKHKKKSGATSDSKERRRHKRRDSMEEGECEEDA